MEVSDHLMRHYLPAFLIAALQLMELRTGDNLPPTTVFSLSPLHKDESISSKQDPRI
jgi:hypothetical protein